MKRWRMGVAWCLAAGLFAAVSYSWLCCIVRVDAYLPPGWNLRVPQDLRQDGTATPAPNRSYYYLRLEGNRPGTDVICLGRWDAAQPVEGPGFDNPAFKAWEQSFGAAVTDRVWGIRYVRAVAISRGYPTSLYRGYTSEVFVPFWLVLLIASTPLLTLMWRAFSRQRHRRRVAYRREHGLCLECGYDLRGSARRCPECGAAAPAPEQPRPVRRRPLLRCLELALAAALLVCGGLLLLFALTFSEPRVSQYMVPRLILIVYASGPLALGVWLLRGRSWTLSRAPGPADPPF